MRFEEIDSVVQKEIFELLDEHAAAATKLILRDKELLPMLRIESGSKGENQIVALQPEQGAGDVDRAYEHAVGRLRDMKFEYALFSYSTQVGLSGGKQTRALKNVVFTGNGLEITLFIPFKISGFLRKQIEYGKIIVHQVRSGAFE